MTVTAKCSLGHQHHHPGYEEVTNLTVKGPISALLSQKLQLKKLKSTSPAELRQFLNRRIDTVNGVVPKSRAQAEKLLKAKGELCIAFKSGRVGVGVLCGFLGAGKTTLLNNLLSQKHGRNVAVVVNDLSVVNVDSQQIVRKTEELVELQNGCICCTLRGDLIEGLVELAQDNLYDYVFVESTGVGEPIPIAQTFDGGVCEKTGVKLSDVARLDAMVTVVDVSAFSDYFCKNSTVSEVGEWERPEDARSVSALLADQVSCASTVILNKTDLAIESQKKLAKEIVKCLNPAAKLVPAVKGGISWDLIIDSHQWDQSKYEGTPAWIEEQNAIHVPETEEYGISSFAWVKQGADSRPLGEHCLSVLLNGELPLDGVVRAKGWVFVESDMNQRILWQISGGGKASDLAPESRWRVAELEEFENKRLSKADKRAFDEVNAEIAKIKERGAWSEKYGDRRQEVVFIGRREDGFNPAAIREALGKLLDSKPSLVGDIALSPNVCGRNLFHHPALIVRMEGCSREVQLAVSERLSEVAAATPDMLFFTSKRAQAVPEWLMSTTGAHELCAERQCDRPLWCVTHFHKGSSFYVVEKDFTNEVPTEVLQMVARGKLEPFTANWNQQAAQEIEVQQNGRPAEEVTVLEIYEPITDLTLLKPFVNLEALRIHKPPTPTTHLTSLDTLPHFKKLNELNVSDQLLTSLPADFAARYPNLEAFYAANNQIENVKALQPLSKCKKFVVLDVQGNPVASQNEASEKRGTDYRAKLFAMSKSLEVIDSRDREGNYVDVEDAEEDEEMEEFEEFEEDLEEDDSEEEEVPAPPAPKVKRGRNESRTPPSKKQMKK